MTELTNKLLKYKLLPLISLRSSGQECTTYYANMDGCSGLSLDVDNTSGGGVMTNWRLKPPRCRFMSNNKSIM